ncbi:HEAT repeat domain-containing protein [Streptomyces sp. SKN60]|uniref:HEAT repeat domain-containing protein n=1 Tax=Streptomyces sp. SKN60 TaxID=2855506 RepID=UPI0022458892|nr:HEAT repeat domain-containing protein [Streptomyces sp. SKN60]MCX2184138.1 HEAT repeat domain-containing protein [Streptomyces sp. SKN60]
MLRLVHLFDDSEADAFAVPALELFVPWAAEEADLAVPIEVLLALGEHADARAATALLPHAGHPDPRVRHAVANGLGTSPEPTALAEEVREALLVLMKETCLGAAWRYEWRRDGR